MLFKSRLILSILLTFSILSAASAQTKLTPGVWRGILKTSSGNELPFNFEVTSQAGHQQIAIINGTEHYKVPDVKIKGDSVFIKMPLFDSEFRLKLAGEHLTGNWIRHLGDHDSAMPFTATANTSWRFLKDPQAPAFNVSGRWAAVFGEGTEGRDELVGEFKQTGNKLTGTFLSTTGDYRYLEGSVSGNKLYLSCFDGCHAFLFTAKISDDKTLTQGAMNSGLTGADKWKAVKDANAKLPDAYSLTALKSGYKKIDFSFPDINGHKVSLSDPRFKNKVVIVQILGSWCPNCMDETNFIINSGYYKKYHAKGVEVIGLAYERTTDFKKSQKTLAQLKDHFKVPYPLLITGFTPSKGDPMKSLPMLADFKGFPTTIIIDKKGNVRKIHTGFNGPGTGEHYTEFVVEFDKLTEDLLAEKG
jgi:thiol-disulfide isomerase/thioredoxin